ncbi:hypothetical protein SGPA1_31560 [Streptomyces misionensis JCM 4497]
MRAARGVQHLPADQPAGDQRPGLGHLQDGQGAPVRHPDRGRGRVRAAAAGRRTRGRVTPDPATEGTGLTDG